MCILGVRAFRPALRQRKGQKTMRGLGTIINAGAIIAGGLLGLAGDRFLKKSMQDTLMKATGVCVMFIGIGGAIEEMMTVSGQSLVSGSTMMMIGSMVIGSLLIFCVGVNLIWEKKLKVANMLPAILVAVVWAFVLK